MPLGHCQILMAHKFLNRPHRCARITRGEQNVRRRMCTPVG
jgi:hypothetical protein